jgi:hypothetical protein
MVAGGASCGNGPMQNPPLSRHQDKSHRVQELRKMWYKDR